MVDLPDQSGQPRTPCQEKEAFASDPVIVLGMHRSGTSLLTGTLEQAGVFLGQVSTTGGRYNSRGYREFPPLVDLHEAMLEARGGTWRMPPEPPVAWTASERDAVLTTLAPYRERPIWGFKDPRAIWLLEGYLELFPQAKLIGIFRHPDAVAASVVDHQPDTMTLDSARALWLRTNHRLLDLSRRLGFPLLHFGPNGAHAGLFRWPLRYFSEDCRLPLPASGFYDPDLVHRKQGAVPQDPASAELYYQMTQAAWRWLDVRTGHATGKTAPTAGHVGPNQLAANRRCPAGRDMAHLEPETAQDNSLMTDFAAARAAMVDCQVRPSDVTRYPIIDALQSVRREVFVPSALKEVAYSGDMIDLGEGRFILDPRTFAKVLDALAVTPSELVLDLGCGLGYSAAVLAHMAEAVVAVEPVAAMAEEAEQTLAAESIHNVVVEARALAEGDPTHGPYDVIVVEGGIETLPDVIASQLKDGGRIAAIQMQGPVGRLQLGTKRGDRISWRAAFDASAPILPGFEQERGFRF